MRSSIIKIGKSGNKNISLDLNRLIDTRMLVAANSGGGKSWLLRLLVERASPHVQVIVLDHAGEFSTLREKINMLLVGHDGELAIEIKTAKLLARRLMESHAHVVIDLYDLKLNDRRIYVNAFLNSLLNLPRKLWHPALIILDEAHIYCPEHATKKIVSADAVINLLSQGRKHGYAGVLATQRLSKINKDAIAETNNVFMGRISLDIDQRRAGDILGMRKEQRVAMRDLNPGEFYGFGPALNSTDVIRFKSDQVATTHPTSGQRHKLKTPPASEAILSILSQMGDIPAQVQEEEDLIARLQGENIDLKRQMAQLKREKPQPEQITKQVTVEVPYLPKNRFRKLAEVLQAGLLSIAEIPNEFIHELERIEAHQHGTKVGKLLAESTKVPAKPIIYDNDSGDLPIGEHKTLTACAQYPDGLKRDQISILTNYKRSSRDAYVNRLQKRGAVEVRGGKVFATDLGYQLLGPGFKPLPTGQALLDYWMHNLPLGEKLILEVLVEEYPLDIPRDYLSETTEYKRSSRDAYINRLKAKELIQIPAPGMVKASDSLMVELA